MERLRIDLKRLEKENAHLNDLLRQRKETCHAECNKRHKEALCRFACSVLEKLKAISYVESLVTHSLDALCNAYQQVDGPLSQISSFCDVIEEISSMQGPSSSSQSISSELLSGSGSTRKVTTDIGCNRPEKKRSTAVQPTAVASTMHVGNKVDTVNTNAVSKLKQPPSGVEKKSSSTQSNHSGAPQINSSSLDSDSAVAGRVPEVFPYRPSSEEEHCPGVGLGQCGGIVRESWPGHVSRKKENEYFVLCHCLGRSVESDYRTSA
uniref:Shugoshin C-terminal domain-containing protein n=1 Tax=Trichuris muris TaxID=70415 RepID=A0A5S6QU50_TRIMR